MTKILVVSDTHGAYKKLVDVIKQNADCDTIIFCGDGIRDMRAAEAVFSTKRFYCVKGNCDLALHEQNVITPIIDGMQVYITHGCEVPRSDAASRLSVIAKSNRCGILMFGHTHRAMFDEINGVIVINPGSLGYNGAYAVVTLGDGNVSCEILTLE